MVSVARQAVVQSRPVPVRPARPRGQHLSDGDTRQPMMSDSITALQAPSGDFRTRMASTVRRQWPAALLLSVLLLLPFARLVELPLLAMAVIGIRLLLVRREQVLGHPAFRWILLLFACYWIPSFASAIDASAPAKSWGTVAAQLRFLPVAAFCTVYLKPQQLRWLGAATATLVLLWTVDALVQAGVGYNLLGMPDDAERLNGVFGRDNIKLGHMLAVLAPFALELARRQASRLVLVGVYALIMAVIVLTGTRAAWVMYLIVTVTFLYLYARRRPRRWLRAISLLAAGSALFLALAYQGSEQLRERMDRSMLMLEGDAVAMDTALSMRLPIWQASVNMGREHWINGVGVRGFRHAYPSFAPGDDPWVTEGSPDVGASHAHQLVLEVWTETGLIGVLGLLVGLSLALLAWRRSPASGRQRAIASAAALVAMLFPINTHLALFSTFWSIVFWWLVIVYCSCLNAEKTDR